MKKIVKAIAIVSVIGATFIALNHFEHNYTREAVVSSVCDDVITFTDSCGLDWGWIAEENESFSKGQTVELKMFDSCTTSAYDDEITKVVIK